MLDKVKVHEGEQRLEVPLDGLDFLDDGGEVSLSFHLSHADRVYDQSGRVSDPRKLGLWLGGLEIETLGHVGQAPGLALNRSYATTLNGEGRDMLGFGFSYAEASSTWIDGKTARLRFRLPPDIEPRDQMVSLNVGGRRSETSGRDQTCTISVNGQRVLDDVKVFESEQKLNVSLEACSHLEAGDLVTLELKLRHAEQVVDQTQRVVDTRRLGLWVSSVELIGI